MPRSNKNKIAWGAVFAAVIALGGLCFTHRDGLIEQYNADLDSKNAAYNLIRDGLEDAKNAIDRGPSSTLVDNFSQVDRGFSQAKKYLGDSASAVEAEINILRDLCNRAAVQGAVKEFDGPFKISVDKIDNIFTEVVFKRPGPFCGL